MREKESSTHKSMGLQRLVILHWGSAGVLELLKSRLVSISSLKVIHRFRFTSSHAASLSFLPNPHPPPGPFLQPGAPEPRRQWPHSQPNVLRTLKQPKLLTAVAVACV